LNSMRKSVFKGYYEETDKLILYLSEDDNRRLKFVQNYMTSILLRGVPDMDKIQLGPMDKKMLKYLIFSIVLEYDNFIPMPEE
jgi:hypothetical protein